MKNFKTIGWLLIVAGIAFAFARAGMRIYAGYTYKVTIGSNWTLADRASTLKQKSEYIDKFVKALDQEELHGSNSNLILQTPSTDFNENLKAVKSLKDRLDTVATMDENSFAYQTALHQITEQEQGQATELLQTLSSCWLRINWPTLWNPVITIIYGFIQFVLIYLGIAFINRNILWWMIT